MINTKMNIVGECKAVNQDSINKSNQWKIKKRVVLKSRRAGN